MLIQHAAQLRAVAAEGHFDADTMLDRQLPKYIDSGYIYMAWTFSKREAEDSA
jgi:hypothetical protein